MSEHKYNEAYNKGFEAGKESQKTECSYYCDKNCNECETEIRADERAKLKNKIESFRLSAYLTLANSGDDKKDFAYEQVVWVLDHLNKELDLRESVVFK